MFLQIILLSLNNALVPFDLRESSYRTIARKTQL